MSIGEAIGGQDMADGQEHDGQEHDGEEHDKAEGACDRKRRQTVGFG
jgi:hypothetical protein